MANNDDYESIWPPPQDLELRNIALDPRPEPIINVVLVTGIQHPGVQQVCQRFAKDFCLYYLDLSEYITELCDITKHDRKAYGYLHPTAFGERFFKHLHQYSFTQSIDCTFFLRPVLKYKIEREIANGWTRFLISGLETLLRATREFTMTIAQPVAVLCFSDAADGRLGARALIEQLFSGKEMIEVCLGASPEATYSKLLAKTMGEPAHVLLVLEHIGR